jgi:hypothetical protein
MTRTAQHRVERRSRGEIDRNFLFGDIFMRTGNATAVAILAIALYTPFSIREAFGERMYGYLGLMIAFGLTGMLLYFYGRHLRRCATHWEVEEPAGKA